MNNQKSKIAVILLAFALQLLRVPQAQAATRIGNKLNNFKVTTTTGETFDLYATLEEKSAVMITLWYIGCDTCPSTLYGMEQAQMRFGDQIAFIALDVQGKDQPEAMEAYVRGLGLENLVLAKDSGVKNAVGAQGVPHMVLVGKGGYILSDDMMRDMVETALDFASRMTEKDYEDLAAWVKNGRNKASQWFNLIPYRMDSLDHSAEESKRDWVARASLDDHRYTPEAEVSFRVEGEGLRAIQVEENESILKRWTNIGAYYIVPDGTELTVSVTLGENVDRNIIENSSFHETFQEVEPVDGVYVFHAEARNLEKYTFRPTFSEREGVSGFICFSSEETAEWYFRNLERDTTFSYPWHIE